MAGLSKLRYLALASFTALAAVSVGEAARADGGRLPPPPLPGAGGSSMGNAAASMVPIGGVSGGASQSLPAAGGASAGRATMPTAAEVIPPAGAALSAAPAVNTADLVVVPGPGEDKRRALLGRIMEAKSRGIGTSTYMMAFDALEQSVKSGVVDDAVSKRVDSLNSSLDEQFTRSAILKTQRAAPPVAASGASTPLGSGSIFGTGGPGMTPGSNTDTAALIQKLQSKYGGQIPDQYKDKIPAGLGGSNPADLLKNPQVQDLLKGMKNK